MLEDLVRDAVARLREGGVAPEVLGERRTPRRVLGVGRGPRIVAVGEVWRVGALLLMPDGGLALAGESVRTAPETTRGYTADSARHRAELRDEARRGGIPAGVVVHLDPVRMEPEHAPLALRDGEIWFTWSPGATAVPLREHLRERVTLALEQATER